MLVCLTGVVMYAYFSDIGCDPLAEGVVTNGNQVGVYKKLLEEGVFGVVIHSKHRNVNSD